MKKLFLLVIAMMLALGVEARTDGQFFKKLSSQNIAVEGVEQQFAQWFSLPDGTEWREVSRTTDLTGMERIEYRQYVAGIEVEHSQILIHAKDGRVRSANGMVMENRRSPARIRRHNPIVGDEVTAGSEGREQLLINTRDGFRYAYKVLSADKKEWRYYDAETQELLKSVPLVHGLTAVDEEGTPVEVGATTLYSGQVTLDASQRADGTTYLYDAKRNIHTLSGAYIPTIEQLGEMGMLFDYFPKLNLPDNLEDATDAQIKEWENGLLALLKQDELETVPMEIRDFATYVDNEAGEDYTAFRVKNVTFEQFMNVDEEGNLKPFVPIDLTSIDWGHLPDGMTIDDLLNNMAPRIIMHFNYGADPENPSLATVASFGVNLNIAKEMPYTYQLENIVSSLPRDGVTLHVLTVQKNTEADDDTTGEDDDDDDDTFDMLTTDDDDDEDDEDDDDDEEEEKEKEKYDTLAVIRFVPDASGKIEFKNERMTFSIEYEKAGDPVADVHWGMAQTLDFYKDVFGRNGYDDNGAPVYNLVYNLHGYNTLLGMSPQNSAAFSGKPFPMLYGLGSITLTVGMSPVVELSVMAHEFTHIITDMTAQLEYQGESGALNESFSDIMGISVKKHVKDDANWFIAEGVVYESLGLTPYTNMRDMAYPKNSLDGNDPNPDTYQGEYWLDPEGKEDHGGVHTNSGVQNKWYYLLTDGGSGTNDKGTAYDVKGIGIEKSQRIAYLTLTSYATMESDYAAIREASLEAAAALYGEKSNEAKTVAQAWDAVGVEGSELVSIEQMTANEAQAGRIYDLQGRQLNEVPAEGGFYIVDGRKVIVR